VPIAGLYEPVHGSAPDIAGRGIANPMGTLLSVGLMFEYSFGLPLERQRIDAAIHAALMSGVRTQDIGGSSSTSAATMAVIDQYRRLA
jgi:3-isopropylmalate dehydrogenase